MDGAEPSGRKRLRFARREEKKRNCLAVVADVSLRCSFHLREVISRADYYNKGDARRDGCLSPSTEDSKSSRGAWAIGSWMPNGRTLILPLAAFSLKTIHRWSGADQTRIVESLRRAGRLNPSRPLFGPTHISFGGAGATRVRATVGRNRFY